MHELPIEDSLDLHTFAPRDVVDVVQEYLLAAHEAGASKSELGRQLNVSRQRIDEILSRARHEAAAGMEHLTD